MKTLLLSVFLSLSVASSALATGTMAAPVQFPDQRFPAQDPFVDIERQQITQETLMILRDMVNVMRQARDLAPDDMERLENLSSRLDFLITRQQELTMRSRMGR